jgi:hypothetical protein
MRRRYPVNIEWPRPQQREYWEALGQFIDTFAECEAVMAFALESYSDVSPQVAKALFSGVRTDAAANYILRILEVRKDLAPDRETLQAAFTQMGHINRLRNDIVHHGARFKGEFPIVSNKRAALTRTRLRETLVSASLLDAVIEDLETINAQIRLTLGKELPSAALYLEHYGPDAQRPWRYKPAQPTSGGGKSRPKPQRRKPQRRSSRE